MLAVALATAAISVAVLLAMKQQPSPRHAFVVQLLQRLGEVEPAAAPAGRAA